MKSNEYWKRRAEARMKASHDRADKTVILIRKAYDKAIKNIDEDIKNIFENFANLDGMTKAEAMELLNERVSNEALKRMIEALPLIQNAEVRQKVKNMISANAYKYRIARKELLKQSIRLEMAKLADQELTLNKTLYGKVIKETYGRCSFDTNKGIGVVLNFGKIPERRVKQILKEDWSGKHYSKRIWGNTAAYGEKVQQTVLEHVMTGNSVQKASADLANATKVGKFNAERLVRTETTYFTTKSDIEAYEDMGIEKLRFVATLDSRTSKICQEHDGDIIPVDEAVPGVNVSPMHPHCRSCTVSVIDDEDYDTRAARGKDGKRIMVPASMTYAEYKKKYLS